MEALFLSLSESVSEECYNDILGIVEEIINEGGRRKDYDAEIEKLKELNLLPSEYKEAKEKLLKLKERSEKERAAYAANPEPMKARSKRWADKNIEHVREKGLAYYNANKEQVKAKMNAAYQANPKSYRKASKKSYWKNREAISARRKARYAAKKAAQAQQVAQNANDMPTNTES